MQEAAKRDTYDRLQLRIPKQLKTKLRFTEKQFCRIKKGLFPWNDKDEKWFIFYENVWLYFFRGERCYYIAEVTSKGKHYEINRFWAEGDKEVYPENDLNDKHDMSFLISYNILGIENYLIDFNEKKKYEVKSSELLYPSKGFSYRDDIESVLFGVVIGDALGVPVEFMSRQRLKEQPVNDMIGNGTHNQELGTYSDDGSLTLCLAEALSNDFNLGEISNNFIEWYYFSFWSARDSVFDVGNTTRDAIVRTRTGVIPELAGSTDENSNGNGSLMRILPLLFYLLDKSIDERYDITRLVSSMTHRHIRSIISCFYYLEFARHLFEEQDKFDAYRVLQSEFGQFLISKSIDSTEIANFDRLLKGNIFKLTESKIKSTGYVIDTLEASIWCFLTTDNYRDAVLKAVNLGDDTDTTGAVTGGLAGLYYGWSDIPDKWVEQIARKNDIENLSHRLHCKITPIKVN